MRKPIITGKIEGKINRPLKASVSYAPMPIIWPEIPFGTGTTVMAMQVMFQISERLSPEDILAKQLTQIGAVVEHARKTVPFYQKHYADCSLGQASSFSMADLRNLPILTREHIQNEGDRFVTNSLPPSHKGMYTVSTSGSTGKPLQLKATGLTTLFSSAHGLRYHLWHQRDFAGKNMRFKTMKAGKDRRVGSGWVEGLITGSVVLMNQGLPTDTLLRAVLDENPKYLQLHPSTLTDILRLSEQSGKKPTNLAEVRVVSETLDPNVRDYCWKVWGVPITDNYSCEEMGIMALQCPEHEHLHVQSENCLIEVLDEEGDPCLPGQIGRVVVTGLNNYASPLIRYENGDMAEVGSLCSCGRGLPVLTKIAGRVRNLVMLPSGQRATPIVSQIANELLDLPVRQIQYVQKTLALIEIHLVVSRQMTAEEEAQIGNAFNKRLGQEFQFTYHYHDEIKRLPSGKYEEFRCDVAR